MPGCVEASGGGDENKKSLISKPAPLNPQEALKKFLRVFYFLLFA
jgi:hypothetical protein